MVHSRLFSIAVLSVILYVVEAEIFRRVQDNTTGIEERVLISTRRRSDGDKTSSSEVKSSRKDELNLDSSAVATGTSDEKNKKSDDKSTRRRKCQPCPTEMGQGWRQPDIRWICGAYQRARRSFKSICMMRYRNCQDGTMFVKIHSHRCKDDAAGADAGLRNGDHMFYDYGPKNDDNASGSKDDSEDDSSGSYTFEQQTRE